MCGRYTLAGKAVDLEKHFRAKLLGKVLGTSFNIAPGQTAPVILNTNPEFIQQERWGLIPYWHKPGDKLLKLINSRSDSLITKPGFKRYLERKRCLIPTTGFYEWKTIGKVKQPYFIRLRNEELFSFAGIWEEFANSDAELIYTFSIITTEPNSLMAEIHNRMPVILRKEDESEWLKGNAASRLSSLLVPYDPNLMEAFPVSNRVNSAANNDASLIEEVPLAGLF